MVYSERLGMVAQRVLSRRFLYAEEDTPILIHLVGGANDPNTYPKRLHQRSEEAGPQRYIF